MEKAYDHSGETELYKHWEESGAFTPQIDKKQKPFSVILPLPNANDPMHMGHALFTVQDILVRYHRMKGAPTLWLPGGDHAGIETQFVFEKHLAREGKSRFDFDRNTLFEKIAEFVEKNKDVNRSQMKRLGFSLDWTRYHYSLEENIVKMVLETFRKLHRDKLIYRANRLVNYCVKCGTAFSELEINHVDRQDSLYTLDYGKIKIATVRPETIFADIAICVHPEDKRYRQLIGKTALIPLINREVPIIQDSRIEKEFGTGALKVTPGHDKLDYEIGLTHHLPVISVIDRFGKLTQVPEKYRGMKIKAAREAVVSDLDAAGKIVRTEPLAHSVNVCYRCGSTIEPLLLPQWYVKTKPLARKASEAVRKKKTRIVPLKRFEKLYYDWLDNIEDWNISRQIVWGPRIPAWYCLDCNPDLEITFLTRDQKKVYGPYSALKKNYPFTEIKSGLQSLTAPVEAKYQLEEKACPACGNKNLLQETDTFDTWFLSSQWPVNTLKSKANDFEYFYPTSVLDTLWDILFFWVARMMMMGLYLTGKVPFEIVHIHSRVVDKFGQKMSKSKGNVVNPIEMVDKYGADALRLALIFGVAPGSDVAISEDKIRGMRNFANKLWNIGRLFYLSLENLPEKGREIPFYDYLLHRKLNPVDQRIISELNMLTAGVTKALGKYRFSDAIQSLYDFTWHSMADRYLEENKSRYQKGDLTALAIYRHILITLLKLLHPFMPFVTEAIWGNIPKKNSENQLISSSWPIEKETGQGTKSR
jgi:valyl-tRNA synthetase